MAVIEKEKLIKIISEGYYAALDSCFDNKSIYVKGFFDGMKFQKDGTIPKNKFDIMLEKCERNIKDK